MTTYSEYLEIEQLLALQHVGGDEHDEMLFIIIHQSYELWFKQVLHEIDYLQGLLAGDDLNRANHTMKRVLTILKMLVAKIDILETMTPLEFLSFRERLESGSGFQSRQFRELEYLLGHKRPLKQFPEGSNDDKVLKKRLAAPTLWDSFLGFISRRGGTRS
jgi:tryptophan 2,3-dioxygenase